MLNHVGLSVGAHPKPSHSISCNGASNQFLSNKLSAMISMASGEEVGDGVVSSHEEYLGDE